MKAIVTLGALMCLFACGSNDEAKVEECFQTYLVSILNSKGRDAVACIDSRTKLYYQDMLNKALHLSEEKTRTLPIADMMIVLMARQQVPKDSLLAMNGGQFLTYAIDQGWVGKDSVMGLEISEVEIKGDMANTKIQKGNTVIPFGFHFYKEEDAWRINLSEMLKYANVPMQQLAKQSGMDADQFVLHVVSQISGTQPNSGLWNPIQ